MKIGIVTLSLHYNYGGILQAYALQKYLKSLGHEAWLIKTNYHKQSFGISDFGRNFIKKFFFKKHINNARDNFELDVICENTNRFINKYIDPITFTIENNDGWKWLDVYKFDGFIVGSDQVWRQGYTKKKKVSLSDILFGGQKVRPNFLDFVKSSNIKRVAFAASFGVDYWEYDKRSTKIMGTLLKQFNAISVREDSAVSLCKEYLEVDAIHVLDPTLLLTSSDYLKLCENEKTPKMAGNMMFYLMDEEKIDIANWIAENKGLKPFSVTAITKKPSAPLADRVYPPVTDWIRGFYDANYIVTDSFHGAALSIIFNKPFTVIGHEIGGMARFNSLLKMFGLEDRLILNKKELSKEKIQDIDYDKVNEKLQIKQKEALGFLTKALS